MEPLDAFLAVWEQARATFGEGVPHDRTDFDKSAELRSMQEQVQSAGPGSHWTGAAADLYAEANEQHGRKLGQLADLDEKLGNEVERSADVVTAGRRELDALKQWVTDLADEAEKTPTAANDHALWSAIGKASGDVADIIQRSHSDLSGVAGRIQGLDSSYGSF
ncbi:MAG: EspA/EspE family type VII secretion system effector [Mycobacterium sp.]|nr:EspA/EspE family type VII secretion system effector [Mycobacterium sp.]